jgi:Protein of unknown function (DUF2934)
MPESDRDSEQAIRERAYLIWEREGRPEGRAADHWRRATIEGSGDEHERLDGPMADEEKILVGRTDVNIPALLTKDVRGG